MSIETLQTFFICLTSDTDTHIKYNGLWDCAAANVAEDGEKHVKVFVTNIQTPTLSASLIVYISFFFLMFLFHFKL